MVRMENHQSRQVHQLLLTKDDGWHFSREGGIQRGRERAVAGDVCNQPTLDFRREVRTGGCTHTSTQLCDARKAVVSGKLSDSANQLVLCHRAAAAEFRVR